MQKGVVPTLRKITRRSTFRTDSPTQRRNPGGAQQTSVVFVLAEFTDRKGTYSQASFAKFLKNNIADYFKKASNGRVKITPAKETHGTKNNGVIGWINLKYDHPNFAAGGGSRMWMLARKAMIAADKYIDYEYYDKNKDLFKDTFKSIKYLELNSQNLTSVDEVNDLFFQKIDEIDDLIVGGENLNFILKKYNLENANLINFNKFGIDKNGKEINDFPKELINNIFINDNFEQIALIENKNKYYIIEILETESIQRQIDDFTVKKIILEKLNIKNKIKFITEIISKINDGNFKKVDFDNLSQKEKVEVKKIKLNNLDDNKALKKDLVKQVYSYPEKQVIVVADIGLTENYLIYIDKVENVEISKSDDDYQKYFGLSKIRMANNLYNTYDIYLKNKYEIKINYKALDNIKNYF